MARCPFAEWRPLGPTQPPKMDRHDLVIFHTMGGGSLASTDRNFHLNGYGGLESHFGIGADGTLYQWVDTDHIADANLYANPRAISIETADSGVAFKSWTGSDVPAWNDAQLATAVKVGRWCCDTHSIPKVMVPDSKPTRRGIAGHRQGINSSPPGQPGYRVPGGELWSDVLGKVCPGDRRFAQLKSVIVPAVNVDPTTKPPVPGGEPMYQIAKIDGYSANFQTDGKNAWWLQSTAERKAAAYQAAAFYGSPTAWSGTDANVVIYTPSADLPVEALLRLLMPGGFLGPVPPGWTLSEDRLTLTPPAS